MILDFDKIRKYVNRSGMRIGTEGDSPRKRDEHLMIVFFDALLIDDDIVMAERYEVRRKRLRDLISYYPGHCITSDWGQINFKTCSAGRAARKVNKLFAKAIARRCEGLILKPCDGPYFALDQSTVAGKVIKLKKDYIPGLGDTADFAIVGARRSAAEMSRSSLLGTRWTDFVVACVQNKVEVCRYHARPVLRILDVLSRPCISIPDMQWICENGQFHTEDLTTDGIQSNFDIMQEMQSPSMTVVFKKPFIVEVLGSSFDKPSSKNYYALRHARILKIHRDRGIEDVIGFHELQELAYQAKRLPADVQAEETEWLSKLHASCHTKGQERISQASNTTTATRSPGSTVPSPAKPSRLPQPSLVRIDTVELLPGEERTSQVSNTTTATRSPRSSVPSKRKQVRLRQPSVVRIDTAESLPGDVSPLQTRTARRRGSTVNAASLQTPPPSSPSIPTEHSSLLVHDLRSRKRKRPPDDIATAEAASSTVLELESPLGTDMSTPTSGRLHNQPPTTMSNEVSPYTRALADITNTPPRPDPLVRSQTEPSYHEIPSPSQGRGLSSKRTRSSRALCRSARLLQIIDIVPSSPSIHMGDLALSEIPSSPLLQAVNAVRLEIPPPPPPVQAVDLARPKVAQSRTVEDVAPPPSSAPITHTDTRPNASVPTNALALPPLALPTVSTTRPAVVEKPHHPFSNHIFLLAPCIRHMLYLTENLFPLLFSPSLSDQLFAPASSEAVSAQDRIIDSLSPWLRDLRPPSASTATYGLDVDAGRTVPEFQSFPGMQKAVLVEPRRVQQTRDMVDMLCAEMVLKQTPSAADLNRDDDIERALDLSFHFEIEQEATRQAGETVQFYDWRVVEDVVQLMLKQRTRFRQLPGVVVGAADEVTRRDIEKQIQIDANAELDGILRKRYLGCVASSRTLGRNVWVDAGLGRDLGEGCGL